jgi:hypothetical protein
MKPLVIVYLFSYDIILTLFTNLAFESIVWVFEEPHEIGSPKGSWNGEYRAGTASRAQEM